MKAFQIIEIGFSFLASIIGIIEAVAYFKVYFAYKKALKDYENGTGSIAVLDAKIKDLETYTLKINDLVNKKEKKTA